MKRTVTQLLPVIWKTLLLIIRKINEPQQRSKPYNPKKHYSLRHPNAHLPNRLLSHIRNHLQNQFRSPQHIVNHHGDRSRHLGGSRYYRSYIGFGLVFSYMKRLVWSGLGFTLFITAFCIEFYPLINDFWNRARINYSRTPIYFDRPSSNYELYLANANLPTLKLYGNCITNCLRCALAVAVAFSSILGRAGHLECFLTAVFGTIGYELNRQVIANLSVDGFGTYSIFTFGGFMGLAMGLILKMRESRS